MGGNVVFGDKAADRIDLTKIDRAALVRSISSSLALVNKAFEKSTGFPIWRHGIQEYLSGSTSTLFDLKNISDEAYKKAKPSVGDIDTQVDGNNEEDLFKFLTSIRGKKFGDLKLINHKSSIGAIVSLWEHVVFGVNIQIDLELVSFVNGKPNAWSKFAYSSAWEDMAIGIKGIAHKYIFRAITAVWNKDIKIQMKTKQKDVTTSHLAFSNSGLRVKLEPVKEGGKQVMSDGKPVFKEISTKDSGFNTDIGGVFSGLFGVEPTKEDLSLMNSYIGVIKLCKKYHKKNLAKIADGMANLLFGTGSGGQVMYPYDHSRDRAEKLVIINYMAKEFGLSESRWSSLIDGYYKRIAK